MFKAILFDWGNTLARPDPPPEQVSSRVLKELGIELSPGQILPGMVPAERRLYDEVAAYPPPRIPREEVTKMLVRFHKMVFSLAGSKLDDETVLRFMQKKEEMFPQEEWALYDDVLSTLKELDGRGLTLGLLSNMRSDMAPVCRKMGLEPYLDFVVTSQIAGADKPHPRIFLAALERAGVTAAEAIHVGDQYRVDVLGARGVGITPILLDRLNAYPEVTDCVKITSLSGVLAHL